MEQTQQVLFICNTPFQIVTAVCIREHFLTEAAVDLIITDQIQSSPEIAEKTEGTGLFRNVFRVSNNDFIHYRGPENKKPETVSEKLRFSLSARSLLKRMFGSPAVYDDLFLFNWDRFTVLLFEELRRRNRRLSVHLYEEGITSYEHILLPYECSEQYAGSLPPWKRAARRLLGHPELYTGIRDAYVFRPEMLGDGFPLPVWRIPLLKAGDNVINRVLFSIFDCDNIGDYLSADVFFFEESYVQDGIPMDYGAILKPISELTGKDRILIKRHPRSQDDVFERLGYRVNTLQYVPWEILVLRHPELCRKIWVSVCCSSMICPYYLFGLETNCVFLFRMTGYRPNEQIGAYYDHIREHLLDPHPEVFVQPETHEQLTETIHEKLSIIQKEDKHHA